MDTLKDSTIKPKSIFHNLCKPYFLLFLIIVVQLFYTTYCFSEKKQGYHSDEIWSYGLANSYYQPFIYMKDGVFIDDFQESDTINENKWIDGEVLNEYITVQPDERFAYKSVYHNQTLDHHPPLYYMVLHTVCSFFPNNFSFWYAYILSAVFLVVTQIFLYKLAYTLSCSEKIALITCFAYGAGTGALSTFIFLRQYSMLTMLITMYTYYNAAFFQKHGTELKKYLPAIAITSFAAFMTHYTAIAYIGIFTACFCIYFLCRKQIKKMFIYGGTVLGTLVLYFAVYPAALMQIFKSHVYDNTVFTFSEQLRVITGYLTKYNLGFAVSVYKSSMPYVIFAVLVTAFAFAVPLCYLFRNEKWFLPFKNKMKNMPADLALYVRNKLSKKLAEFNYVPLFIVFSVFAVLCTVCKICDVITMGSYSVRYVFSVFPTAVSVCVLLIRYVISLINVQKVKKFLNVLVMLAVTVMVVRTNMIAPCKMYAQHEGDTTGIDDMFDGKNCVVVIGSRNFPWLITCYCSYLKNADNVFFISDKDMCSGKYEKELSDKKIDYVLVEITLFSVDETEWKKANIDFSEIIEVDTVSIEKGVTSKIKHDDCTDLIKELNDNDGYDLKSALWIQGGYSYVLEMK